MEIFENIQSILKTVKNKTHDVRNFFHDSVTVLFDAEETIEGNSFEENKKISKFLRNYNIKIGVNEILGNMNFEDFQFVFSRLKQRDTYNILPLVHKTQNEESVLMIKLLKENPQLMIDDYYELEKMWGLFEIASYLAKIYQIHSTSQLIEMTHKNLDKILGRKFVGITEKYILNFFQIAQKYCPTAKLYENWKASEKSGKLQRLLSDAIPENLSVYLSSFDSLDDFLQHIENPEFLLLNQACAKEGLLKEEGLFFATVHDFVINKKYENPTQINQKYLNLEMYQGIDFMGCPQADPYFYEILQGNICNILKTYYFQDELVGFTKDVGEPTFLALKDTIDEYGNVVLIKGCIYGVEWNPAEKPKRQIDFDQSPKSIFFMRSLHKPWRHISFLKIGQELEVSLKELGDTNLQEVRKDIDVFLQKYGEELTKK